MNISIYDLTIPQFTTTLKALRKILVKAQGFAESKKIDSSVLLQLRLAPDQFPFVRQIQIATDNAKGCVARLTNVKTPAFEDNEKTMDELLARIDKTIAFLGTVKPQDFEGYENKQVSFPWYPGKFLAGKDYLVQHLLPNFYFHATTAYSILRSNGMELGKSDYLGEQNWKSQ